MNTTQPIVVEYDEKFNPKKIWKTFFNFGTVMQQPPVVQFIDSHEIPPTLRNRMFIFDLFSSKDRRNGMDLLGIILNEEVLGNKVELCRVICHKEPNVKEAPFAITFNDGNYMKEESVKEILLISEGVIRNHPEYEEIN